MHEFSLEDPIEEMDEADLRSTLDEFMEKHAENVAEYDELVAERDEFSENVDTLEGEVAEYSETADALRAKFAEAVAEETPLFDADEVAERFSLEELIEKADSLGEFSLAEETVEETVEEEADEEEAGDEPTFADKPDRAPTGEKARSAYREEAESDLKAVLGDF